MAMKCKEIYVNCVGVRAKKMCSAVGFKNWGWMGGLQL
jgi:hypothetical protein